jgi:glutamyl-tRNA synthetase
VLRRADGFLAYHLATAVDELALGITDVVRGCDLWAATGPQVAVMRELDGSPPQYWHLPLWLDEQGQRLSKRDGGLGLETMAEQGLDAAAVVGLMAASVQLVPPGSRLSGAELLQECSLDRLQAVLARRA